MQGLIGTTKTSIASTDSECTELSCDPSKVIRSRRSRITVQHVFNHGIAAFLGLYLLNMMGLPLVLMACAAVLAGEGLAYWVSKRVMLKRQVVRGVLMMNSIAWMIPFFGIAVAALTFGIAEKQIIGERPRRLMYKAVSLLAIIVSLGHLMG